MISTPSLFLEVIFKTTLVIFLNYSIPWEMLNHLGCAVSTVIPFTYLHQLSAIPASRFEYCQWENFCAHVGDNMMNKVVQYSLSFALKLFKQKDLVPVVSECMDRHLITST